MIISVADSKTSKHWKNIEITWEEFLQRAKTTIRTTETVEEYKKLPKPQQDALKNVGGFVGGRLKDGKRKTGYVEFRSMITLDADYAMGGLWDYIIMLFDFTCCIYSTHRHTEEKPRMRLTIPLSRNVTADEYAAIARKVAFDLNIEQFDDTTYEPSRLMFWSSTSSDGAFVFEHQEGVFLDPDKILASYKDWKDTSSWPVSSRQTTVVRRSLKSQADPLEKPGAIGAFCRAYSIQEVINKFIPEVYKPSLMEGRYDYIPADSTAGLVIYNEKFAYSHHATDPICGRLCNAFDIVRLHKFGDRDADALEGTPQSKLPSYLAMQEFAVSEPEVKKQLINEKLAAASEDFNTDKAEWADKLIYKKDGTPAPTIENIRLLLTHDENLAGTVGLNEFAHRNELLRDLPWRGISEGKAWTDSDDAALRHYLERVYGISHITKTLDAFSVVTTANRFNPVTGYLNNLIWDGIERVDTLLIDYFNAEDTLYTRAITRKTLCAAVARAFNPGCKYDYMLLLVGMQGLGKSYFVKQLGQDWFSDSLTTVIGKEAYEQLQGIWIVEMGELAAARKVEIEALKHFISKQEDIFREAYGRRTAAYPRQCIFIGTTNDMECLRDRTGNRRFLPINCNRGAKSIFENFPVHQIWAEAVVKYRTGEELYLKGKLADEALDAQLSHTEESDKTGQVLEFLEILLPDNWDNYDLGERRVFLSNEFGIKEGKNKRNKVCTSELWCECLGGDPKTLSNMQARELKSILNNAPGWKRYPSKLRFGRMYGVQNCWFRVGSEYDKARQGVTD